MMFSSLNLNKRPAVVFPRVQIIPDYQIAFPIPDRLYHNSIHKYEIARKNWDRN